MDAGEYIIDLRETFPDVWEPSIEQQFSADAKAAVSACAKSDPFAASFAALEAAEREFAEKGADDSRCCRDRESFAKACPGEDADFWLEELSESDDDERIAAIHGGLLRHWRASLERARALWREQMASERIARLYAEYVKRLKCIRKLLAELATFGASGFGWGLEAGELVKHDAATLLSWLRKIEGNQELKRLCDLLGRLMAAEKRKEREEIATTVEYEVPKIDTSVKEEIAGITLGRSIEDVVPSELAACGDPEIETLFELKFIEGRLMCFEKSGVLFEKRTKDEAQTVERETADGREQARRVGRAHQHELGSERASRFGVHTRSSFSGSSSRTSAARRPPPSFTSTAARRGDVESPVTHGRASFRRYTLLPTFESASIGCAHGICGGSTRCRSASATFSIEAAASARKQCPTLPFTDPMPTSGPPGRCSPQSD